MIDFLLHGLTCAFWCGVLHILWHKACQRRPKPEWPKPIVPVAPDYDAMEMMECGHPGHPILCNCPQDLRSVMFRKGRMPL